jgi:hypothetical protein
MERARPSTGLAKQRGKTPGVETRRGNERGCVKMVCCRRQAEERAGEIVPPPRTRVRASRRMRTSRAPSCLETHCSAGLAVEGHGLASRCDAPQHEGQESNEADLACTQTGALVTPTCACVGRAPIVLGLLFTMKIPTQNCKPSARGAGSRRTGISRCCASGREIVPARLICRGESAFGKRASGLRLCLLGQAPELKSFGVDCLFDRVAREFVGRSLLRPDGARCGPRTQLLWKPAAREIARESLQTFPRLRFENINPHDSTLSAVNDTKRRAPCHPRNPRRCLLAARATAASTKRAAVTRARKIRSCTRHAPRSQAGARAVSLRRVPACSRVWPVMADPAPYSGDCRGVRPVCSRPERVVEPLTGTAYTAGIRVWPCFVAHLAVP